MKKLVVCLIWVSGVQAAPPAAPEELQLGLEAAYHAQFDQAYPMLERYITAHPQDPNAYIVRGTVREWEQKLKNWKDENQIIDDFERANQLAFQAYDRDPKNTDYLVNLGHSYLRLGKKWADEGKYWRAALISKKCRKHLEEAIHQDKERWDAYMPLGAFRYIAANLPSGAKPFASLLGITGNRAQGIEEVTLAATHDHLYQQDAIYLLKYIQRKEGNHAKARQLLEDLHGRYPENAEIAYDLAVAYRDTGQYQKTVDYLSDFIKTCHDRYCYLAYALMGQVLALDHRVSDATGAYEQAVGLTQRAKPSAAEIARTHSELGTLYQQQGNTAQARVQYETVLAQSGKGVKKWQEEARKRLAAL